MTLWTYAIKHVKRHEAKQHSLRDFSKKIQACEIRGGGKKISQVKKEMTLKQEAKQHSLGYF